MDERVDIVQNQYGFEMPPQKKRRHLGKPSGTTVVAVIVLVAGLGIIAYPTVSDWWNSYHQTRAIATYVSAVQNTDPEKLDAMREAAHQYNERLTSNNNRFSMSDADKAEYESLLDPAGNGVMGYLQVNAINVDYPIYHGMDESVLQVAVGHLEGTSLPIGGPSTHTAISGHRGLPRARLLTDLDRLVEGDTFSITVLDETNFYEVDQIRIVLPSDLSNLEIEKDKDYATLVTCTPYGINTHRLLVRGHRIDDVFDAEAVTAEAVQIPRYIAITAVGVPMLFAFLVGMLLYYRFRYNVDKEMVTEMLKDKVHAANASAGTKEER